RHPNGLGNDNDLVGRFFMEHWYCDLGLGDWNGGHLALYWSRPDRDGQREHLQNVGDAYVWAQFALSDTFMQRERVAGLSLWFGPNDLSPPSVAAIRRIARSLSARCGPMQFTTDVGLVLSDPVEILRRLRRKLPGSVQPQARNATLRIQFEQTPSALN